MTGAPLGSQSIIIIAIIAWGMYRRIRRNIGRQKLKPGWIIVRMVILSLVSLMLLAAGIFAPTLGLAFVTGALVGVGFSFLGLRHTKFETTAEGHFYTPNTYIGVALSALLIGRIAYRFFVLNDQSGATWQPGHPITSQMLVTFGIIGLTIGYYLSYFIGLFWHTHDKR